MFGGTGSSGASSGALFGTAGSSSNDKTGSGGNILGQSSTGFSFGKPAATDAAGSGEKKDGGSSNTSLFGSGSNIFGQPASGAAGASNSQKPAGSLFGAPSATASTSQPSLFSPSTTTGGETKSLFGQATASPGTTGGGLFAKPSAPAKPSGGLFSNPPASTQTPGTPASSSAPKNLFGSTTPAPAGSTGLFSSTTPAGQPPISLFGASTGGASSQSQSQPDTQASTGSTKPSLFGAAGTSNLFGSKPIATTQPTSDFAGSFKLGQQNDKPAAPAATSEAPKFAFQPATTSSTPAASTGQPAASLFASPPAVSKSPAFSFPTTSSGSKDGQTATSQSLFTPGFSVNKTSSEGSSLFTKPAPATTQSTEQSKQSGPSFPSLGSAQNTTTASQAGAPAPTQPPAFKGFGPASTTAATSAPSAATTSAPFAGFALGASTTTSATAPSTNAITTTGAAKPALGGSVAPTLGTSTIGASTVGPVAPAQSRLRNRTMDEILTRWASDLTRYAKEFKGHAEQVAHWDQIIVDNSAKIDKLYVKTRTCEKQTMSVEMQLSAVENQQNELESWLSKYEGDVEEILAKDGSGQTEPGGPDQERERTYQLAEKLGERLDDMGRDLQSMIEEVNAANAGLGKSSKVDEPITQIVKILNAHLSQLQAIDQGTVSLQAKVSAAQKAASGMNYLNASMNGDSSGAVDDFYRSYMGRR